MKINYVGDFFAPSGYARSTRAMLRALVTAGVQVSGRHHQCDQNQMDFKDDPYFGTGRPVDLRRMVRDESKCRVRIWHETPEYYEPDPTQYNIAHLLWETDKIINFDLHGNPRHNWVRQLNRMDEVWTPAAFEARVFRKSGVKVPICVFPYPIDLELYKPTKLGFEWAGQCQGSKGKMVFLSVFQWTKRKNPNDLLLAWTAEFGNQEDVLLVLKTYHATFDSGSTIPQTVLEMRTRCGVPDLVRNVGITTNLVHEGQVNELYNMCDVLINAGYGEGWGLPCQEAMACGKPVIYTNASAMPEFCVGWPVECDPEPVHGMPHIPWYNSTQNWWRVRINSLRKALRDAYNAWKGRDYGDTFKALGEEARARVEREHTYSIVGNAMRSRLEQIASFLDGTTDRAGLVAGVRSWTDETATVSDPPAVPAPGRD